jgi:hypothetical protein
MTNGGNEILHEWGLKDPYRDRYNQSDEFNIDTGGEQQVLQVKVNTPFVVRVKRIGTKVSYGSRAKLTLRESCGNPGVEHLMENDRRRKGPVEARVVVEEVENQPPGVIGKVGMGRKYFRCKIEFEEVVVTKKGEYGLETMDDAKGCWKISRKKLVVSG